MFLFFASCHYFKDFEGIGTWGKIVSSLDFDIVEEVFQILTGMYLGAEATQCPCRWSISTVSIAWRARWCRSPRTMGMIERCGWIGLSVPFIHTEIYLNEKRLCSGILWITAMELDTFPNNPQSIGGKRCGRYTGDSAPDGICHLPKSFTKCSGKVFQFWCISYQIVIQFACHTISFPRHNILKVMSSHPCLAQRRCFIRTRCWRRGV